MLQSMEKEHETPRVERLPKPVQDALLESIGNTPLVRLRALTAHLDSRVSVWAKLEWFNPGGSVKDRAASNMLNEAERRGDIKPGDQLLDASSGNTGIALAMLSARRGYKLTLCIPKNANQERLQTLRAYGANIVLTSPLEGSDGAIIEARRLAKADSSLHYLDQYANEANWRAHYQGTGPEIWQQTGGRITHFVSTLGTSGTFVGTSRFLKERSAAIRTTSVEPAEAFHGLEGLKHMPSSIIPPIYDSTLADNRLGAPTEGALEFTRRLASEEGLLAGISSGAAAWAALQVASRLTSGVVVTVFPDGGTRYLSEPQIWGDAPQA
jgi:cysteine synthase B